MLGQRIKANSFDGFFGNRGNRHCVILNSPNRPGQKYDRYTVEFSTAGVDDDDEMSDDGENE